MSADNGIYLIEMRDGWRVSHLQGINNMWWHPNCCEDPNIVEDDLNPDDMCYHDKCVNCGTTDPEHEERDYANMEVVYGFFKNSDVYFSKEAAMNQADKIYVEITNDDFCGQVEYGIQVINGFEHLHFPCCKRPHYIPFDNDQQCTNCGKSARD